MNSAPASNKTRDSHSNLCTLINLENCREQKTKQVFQQIDANRRTICYILNVREKVAYEKQGNLSIEKN